MPELDDLAMDASTSCRPIELPEVGNPYEAAIYVIDHLKPPQERLELDFSNLDELLDHPHLLTEVEAERLDDIRFRIDKFPKRFGRDRFYSRQAGILVMADWINARSFSRCGFVRKTCRHWKYCPACAHMEGLQLRRRYEGITTKTNLHFLTISSASSMRFQEPDWCDLGLYWDAGALAVRDLVECGIFQGALKVEEIALKELPSLKVLPHLHFLVAADGITDSVIDLLKESILSHDLSKSIPGSQLAWTPPVGIEQVPQIHSRPVEGEDGLCSVLHYMSKPIDLVRPYRLAAMERPRSEMWVLNQAVADFVAGHDCHILGRHQRAAWGILDPRNRLRYIGQKLTKPKKGAITINEASDIESPD